MSGIHFGGGFVVFKEKLRSSQEDPMNTGVFDTVLFVWKDKHFSSFAVPEFPPVPDVKPIVQRVLGTTTTNERFSLKPGADSDGDMGEHNVFAALVDAVGLQQTIEEVSAVIAELIQRIIENACLRLTEEEKRQRAENGEIWPKSTTQVQNAQGEVVSAQQYYREQYLEGIFTLWGMTDDFRKLMRLFEINVENVDELQRTHEEIEGLIQIGLQPRFQMVFFLMQRIGKAFDQSFAADTEDTLNTDLFLNIASTLPNRIEYCSWRQERLKNPVLQAE